MKISIAQLQAQPNKEENLKQAEIYINKAINDDSDLIVFPETFMIYVPSSSEIKLADVAESLEDNFVKRMARMAKANKIYIIFGMYEKCTEDKERAYNTVVFINKKGEIIYSYRKTHLYDAFVTKESKRVIPGEKTFDVINTDLGNIGLMICYEVRFPEIARKLALEKADVLIIPTAWVKGEMKEKHWSNLLASRAIENTIYVAGANQIGNVYSGSSMIYDPMGVRIASAGEEETLISASIDFNRTKRIREKLPVLENRRAKFY